MSTTKEAKMRLRGVNLGGWLLLEGYLLGGRNISESSFKERFKRVYGAGELQSFEKLFRNNFIREEDFRRIANLRANCIRLPFNYKLLEKRPFVYDRQGFLYLEKVFSWAKRYNLKVILDLHAACGAQNCDWHADSRGKANLWKSPLSRERTYRLWEEIASRFKDREALYGYDVLNEPVVEKDKLNILKEFYRQLVRRIKAIDKSHVIFLEGNLWAQRIDFLKELLEENVTLSIHTYQPLNFTFHLVPNLKYPGRMDGVFWNKSEVLRYLERYYKFGKSNKVDIFVGEFGINCRNNCHGEIDYLKDILKVFEEFSFSYTYWTYKAVSRYVFPDGIYQYLPNSKHVKREGPVFGWETYLDNWLNQKKYLTKFWRTESYSLNEEVACVLKSFFKTKRSR